MSGEHNRQGDAGGAMPGDRRHAPRTPTPGAQRELAAALLRFRQRLATFGLGEVTPPLLDDVGGMSGSQSGQ